MDSDVGRVVWCAVLVGCDVCEGVAMNVGQIKRIGRRTYCIIGWTDYDVTLQSMDEEKYIVVMPRTRLGGLKTGQ